MQWIFIILGGGIQIYWMAKKKDGSVVFFFKAPFLCLLNYAQNHSLFLSKKISIF